MAYQAREHLGLCYKGKGLHIKPLIVIRIRHGGANWMEGGSVVVQVVFTAGRHTAGKTISHMISQGLTQHLPKLSPHVS